MFSSEKGELFMSHHITHKGIYTIIAASFFMTALAQAQNPDPRPVVELLPVTDVFPPLGFDTNDDTQVVVGGYLPDMCFKSPQIKATVAGKEIRLTVTGYREADENEFCLPVLVPYIEPVSLGILDKGTYKVRVNIGTVDEQNSTITIVESTSSAIDDYTYANVNYVEEMAGTRRIYLHGSNPSPCFDLDRVEFVSNGQNTYSVLPILKRVSEVCPQQMTPFNYEADVPADMSNRYLMLHVRKMNGKSVNHLWGELPYWAPSRDTDGNHITAE
jgi:hypothetical protein